MIKELISLILMLLVALYMFQHYDPWFLLVSTIIALVGLKVVGWLGIRVEVNFWSLAIVVIGGIIGFLLVLFLSISGIAFCGRRR